MQTVNAPLKISVPIFDDALAQLKFNVALIPEDDGSVTGVMDELDLVENAETAERCVALLWAAMKDYAQDFAREFNLCRESPAEGIAGLDDVARRRGCHCIKKKYEQRWAYPVQG